ncbi:MAG: tail fiber assembly protein [Chania sp.]
MTTYMFCDELFYPLSLKADYENSENWPTDGIEVSEEIFSEFSASNAPTGKKCGTGDDGMPAWVDPPPPSHDELVAAAEAQKSALLRSINAKTQIWQTQLALGIITDADKSSLIAWMEYAQAVQAIDTLVAPNIEWPQPPALS